MNNDLTAEERNMFDAVSETMLLAHKAKSALPKLLLDRYKTFADYRAAHNKLAEIASKLTATITLCEGVLDDIEQEKM